jgi:hypothetical protein
MTPIPNDPVNDEIREVRHRISERCGHDTRRLVAYYIALQEQYRDRLIQPSVPQERPVFRGGLDEAF